jgi:molecular chaperone GrpE (heat shock protein)
VGRVGAILLVVAAIALPSTGSAQQKLYKWTDENGVVHYSESIPPEYRSREYADPKYRTPEYADPEFRTPEYANPQQRLKLLESQIKRAEAYLGNLRKRLVDLQAEARDFKLYSTNEDAPPIPENLKRDISRTTASIALYEQTLARLRAVQDALKESLDDDIPRLIEVKGD